MRRGVAYLAVCAAGGEGGSRAWVRVFRCRCASTKLRRKKASRVVLRAPHVGATAGVLVETAV